MSGFWKNWLVVWCWGALAFGAVLALSPLVPWNAAPKVVVAILGGDPALLDQPAMQFALGLQGALTIGWMMTTYGMIRAAEVAGAPVWRWLTMSFLVWYVIDSAISVVTGFPLNTVSNTLLMVTFLAPILASGVLRTSGRVATVAA